MDIDTSQLEFVHVKMRILLAWLERTTGNKFTITSLYRINDPGVHGVLPLRGVDIRCRDAHVGGAIESHINKSWVYDPSRPEKKCAILHGNGSNLHLHLQVHPNTKIMED